MNQILKKMILPESLRNILDKTNVLIPTDRNHLFELAMGGDPLAMEYRVGYDIPGKGHTIEATVTRHKNGVLANFPDPYIRRRDPDCTVVADSNATDKERYEDRFKTPFEPIRQDTFEWLSNQDLIVMPFLAGNKEMGYPALMVAPRNAGFFAAMLADLQVFIDPKTIEEGFRPQAVIYVAPPYRHTHFNGKQVVVHNRLEEVHELFSYNLYPGPSAKKGVYGVLLTIGEKENWITVHGSTVMVITPYDNVITIMHEGASGGGKSEMTEQLHRELDGRILLGKNTVSGEKMYVELKEACELRPVTDDMALCHPSIQNESKKLAVMDAENGWFLRTDHIKRYGTDPYLEEMTIHPKDPLIFLNYDAAPGSTVLLWEHIMDTPTKACTNPRVIMPRENIPNVVHEPVEIDVRSFGVRMPPCTAEKPTYGVAGLLHILPPALAWLWRLVAPRGHDNPSIVDSKGMSSEGVGSYWPFATGRKVDQANLLLQQILDTTNTRYILVPNQHIGAYKVGFMPQWIAREYLARRGSARFNANQITASRCALLGYAATSIKVDGEFIPREMLEVNKQPEIGDAGYDAGAKILADFFKSELKQYLTDDLMPLGRQIIECCLNDGTVEDYMQFISMKL